ncbi:DNA-binding HTH domain in riboflavin kinase / CTP-dependent archaeal riboflavin kinase [Halorubrum sp. DM2]|uniref:CTP-dependent riboflavin kinase n=1 Tax=Halorubrum sp. DM2 TaxID=2527867 RepID=UPI0024B76BA8|nr:CTP-dependent riboflavin kinase [Halorubrum sp. DM2]VTT87019.1 DNA-binding HTH domain in riboflavin kinase / CTP-dependent archaeal riboflavin kinase [Halorubrum sp. DM2]
MSDATATDANTDVDPAALAALKHVGLVGGLSETKVSCAALGDRLDASTQTASRRLQTLESAGYVERDVVSDGQWVRVTDAGEAALRAEYADYRRLFESDVELALRGAITGGMGEGRHYITLPGYAEQFRERLGYDPFPGTLNVNLTEESVRRRGEMAGIDAVPIDAWEGEDRTYGAATCYGVTLVAGDERYEEVHAIVPDRTHHDDDQLELIAPDRLRDALDLEDGDAVEVRVEPTSRADEPEASAVETEVA